MDNYIAQPLADLKALAAERVFVECGECKEVRDRDPGWAAGCLDCEEGKRWLLRKPCSQNRTEQVWPGKPNMGTVHMHGRYFTDSPSAESEGCLTCNDVGYVFDDSEDSVSNAIAAMEWSYRASSIRYGIEVELFDSALMQYIVWRSEGITSLTRALLVSLLRALDSQK